MRSQKTFLKLLQLDLESHPPRAPVIAIALEAVAVDPRIVQQGLFLPTAPEPEKLELTLGRIAKLVGAENVGTAELLDSYRPGAFRMKRFGEVGIRRKFAANSGEDTRLALRVFRPARRARVELGEGRPRRIAARGLRGAVVSGAGPWRSSGEWWQVDAWSRDEWDVALSDGALYRIYRDRLSGDWFVEGRYD
jgi:protein ImuB